jgi:hypothetical protein
MMMKPAAIVSAVRCRLSRAVMRLTMFPPRRAMSFTPLTLVCVAWIFSRLRPSSSVMASAARWFTVSAPVLSTPKQQLYPPTSSVSATVLRAASILSVVPFIL